MDSRYTELLNYLKKLGVEGITKGEKRNLYAQLARTPNFHQLKKELELLYALNQVMVSSYGTVSVNNMLNLYKEIDVNVLASLFVVYQQIKEKSKDELETLRRFKKVASEVLNTNATVNNQMGQMLSAAMKKSLKLKDSLYLTMKDVAKADSLFANCINRSKLFLDQCDSTNLERIVYCLKKDFSLSDDELVRISRKCASIFSSSSSSKLHNLYKNIEEFKDFIRKQSSQMSSAVEINKLLEKEFKEVLYDAASVATINPSNVNKTVKFLMGENIGKIISCDKRVAGVKGNFTPLQLAKIYNESISSLGISVEKVADVSLNISEVYKRVYKKDLDMSKLINGHNFSSIGQLAKEDYLENKKIGEIFEILSMFISAEDMEKLLQNNFSFLIAPVPDVKKSLQEAVLNSNNKDELKRSVLQKIRNHFDIYNGGYQGVKVAATKASEPLNKIGVKSFEEDEIKTILEKLETDSNDIEQWRKKWNKEEKEYRDLEIQIRLEELNGKLDDIQSFLDINFVDTESFIEEVKTIKELFIELDSEYRNIVDNNRLSKSLKELADITNTRLETLKNEINGKFTTAVTIYEQQVESMKKSLQDVNDKMAKNDRKKQRIIELENEINERNINEEGLKEAEVIVDKVSKFVGTVEKTAKKVYAEERRASDLVLKYYNFLVAEGKKKILDGGFSTFSSQEIAKKSATVMFQMFIESLEYEDLIDNPFVGEDGFDTNCEAISYRAYREMLTPEQAKMTDEIYNIYKNNEKKKSEVREQLIDVCKNLKIDASNLSSADKVAVLERFVDDGRKMIKDEYLLLRELSKLSGENIEKILEKLVEEKEKLDIEIEEYCKKIDLLLKEQIRR